eukprot:gene39443-48741_t
MLSSAPTLPVRASHNDMDSLLEEAGDVVFRLDLQGAVLFASKHAMALAGLHSLHGVSLAELTSDTDQPALKAALAELVQSGTAARVEVRLKGEQCEVWFELRLSLYGRPGPGAGILVVGRDLTIQHSTEERLRHMATHDALTELPNRLLLSDRIRMTIAQARRSGQGFSVATIKLVTGRLLATLQAPFEIDTHTIYLGASVGVSVYPQHAEDEVRLVALADAAMSRAKETGKARCVVYSPRHGGPPEHDISLEAAMFQAVREGEFMLYYQPIVDARTREIEGFETLMRWKHPTLGMVPPVRFIPIAETNGLINLLGAGRLQRPSAEHAAQA